MVEAGEGRRFFNYIIDQFVLWLFFKLTFSHLREYFHAVSGKAFVLLFLFCFLRFAYFFLTEYYWGRTPAKFVTNTYVVEVDGNRPTAKAIAIRTLCRIIPFDNLSFFVATNGWHDSISDTRVVRIVDGSIPDEVIYRNN